MMNEYVLKSLALQDKPKDTLLIVPSVNKSLIQPLRDSVVVSDINILGQIFQSQNNQEKEIIKESVSFFKMPEGIINNDEKKETIKSVSVHPFLRCSSNPDKKLTTIEDLQEKKVDYKDILLKNGISQNVPLKYNINFNMLQHIKTEVVAVKSIEQNFENPQHWTLMDIVNKNPPNSWIQVFNESYKDLQRISTFLQEREQQGIVVYPLKKDIFKALHLTKLEKVKIVIIGQDPYSGTISSTGGPVANGLAFSSNGTKIPQTLENIYKVLQKTITGFVRPNHADLTKWAEQEVLLLNSCLTLDDGSPASHKSLWSEFITRIIYHIDKNNPNCIYLLWGNHAQEFSKYITSKNILTTSHPSNQAFRLGFCDTNCFNEANEILKKNNKEPINWNLVN